MYFQYLYIIYKHSVYVQYITIILTNHKITESLCQVGSSFRLCHRKHIVSVTISVVSQMSSTVFFLLSAEGPSPVVNQKISFNIILSLAPAGDRVRRWLWFSAKNSAFAHAPR